VLQPAEIVMQSYNILLSNVYRGQPNIPLEIQLQNVGESVAEITNLTLQFRDSDSLNINNQWTLTGTNIVLPDSVVGGAIFTIFDTLRVSDAATLGPAYAGLRWVYRDVLRPTLNKDSTRLNLDTVNVITPGNIFIDSTTIAGLPNPGFANSNQSFVVQTQIVNNGQNPVDSVVVQLSRNGLPIDTLLVPNVAGNSTFLVEFDTTNAPVSTGFLSVTYRTRILSASIPPGLPLDDTEIITVQTPVFLTLSGVPSNVVLAQSEEFTLTATVSNQGTAGFSPGQLHLKLPFNYSTQPLADDTLRTFNTPGNISWTIRGEALSGLDPDSILVDYDIIPNDLNYATVAATDPNADSIYVSARVETGGQIISSINIQSPSGAVDSTVSTFQTFVIRNIVEFSGSVADTGRTSRIILPADSGFSVQGSTVLDLPDNDTTVTVEWIINAPIVSRDPSNFYVITEAPDLLGGPTIVQTSNLLPLTVVPRAVVSIDGIDRRRDFRAIGCGRG
jgi:hypothetical protein